MKRCLLLIGLIIIPFLMMEAQESYTKAYQRYRPYHYQTPQAWNRIRREVADPGKTVWSLMERDTRFMYLTGPWKEIVPVPVAENTYFFKGEDDLGAMYDFILKPNAHGYMVYPYWIEQQFKFSEDKNLNKNIIQKGFMNTIVSDIPDDVEELIDLVVYNQDSISDISTEPHILAEEAALKWQLSPANRNLCNIRNFYCYFDNRPDSLQRKIRYSTEVTRDFDTEVMNLTAAIEAADPSYVMIPYWMTDVYLSVPNEVSGKIRRFGYPGYVLNPVSGGVELNNNWSSLNIMDVGPFNKTKYDMVVFSGDSLSTDWFLSNPDSWHLFMYNVFDVKNGMINRNGFSHKPSGLNIYFPEFDFRKKRAMTQFVKSISLIIDSLTIDSSRIYSKLDLSLTFPRRVASTHSNYLSGLQCFVDTIYFADFDANGLTSSLQYSDGSIDTTGIWAKVINPFYLFRIPYKTINPHTDHNDLMAIADSDYSSGRWGIYFIIVLILLFALLSILVLRYYSPLINRYMEHHHLGMVLLVMTLVMEICVFFFFMIEALSPQVIMFDMHKDDSLHLFLIAVPILPIAIYLLYKYLVKDNPLP